MRKILASLAMIAMVSTVAVGATRAYFSDTETSNNNTFSAGSLDLTVDGNNGTNTVKFTVNNIRPGNQPTGSWTLANVGKISGYLDLKNITVTNNENGCVEPENEAGDNTCGRPGTGDGELQNVINLRLYIDKDKDGYWSTGDVMIYNGLVKDIAGSYNQNELIAAGSNIRINAVFDWWSTSGDNKAMGDDMTLNITFDLSQNQ